MPRGSEDWSLGKIYRIISNNPEVSVVYYGSTVQSLCRRMASHRSKYKRWCAGKQRSCSIFPYFKQYGIEQFHIELVEDFPCDNGEQLFTRENVYIRGFDCCNKYSAITTPEERTEQRKQHYQDNAEAISIKQKQHYQVNAESINIKKKGKITCVCGCQIRKDSLPDHLKSKKHISLVQI